MLRGVYRTSAGPAAELPVWRRLCAVDGSVQPVLRGSFAALTSGPSAKRAEAAGMTCILDGVLYEPAALRRELSLAGTGDAGLALGAYRRFGLAALGELRGRYTLVIWDDPAARLVLGCDVLATRQLFMRRVSSGLVFANDLHELLRALLSRPAPDPVAVSRWLAGGGCRLGQTLYDGVLRLSPGEAVVIDHGSLKRRTYWRPDYVDPVRAGRDQLASGLQRELRRSVRRRLSPTANAVILSGGLDSSIVTALARAEQSSDASLATYSAVFPGHPYDESAKVRSLTTALGIKPATFQVEPQGCLRHALAYTSRWERPPPGIAALIDGSLVAAAAGAGAEVILDGQTGDEVLGFAPYLVGHRLRRGRPLSALRLIWNWPGGHPPKAFQWRWLLMERGLKAAFPRSLLRSLRARRDRERADPAWMPPGVRRHLSELDGTWDWLDGDGPLWWRHLVDVLIDAPHREVRIDYLRDRAEAADAVNESPLYDPDVISYTLRLPPELGFDRRFDRSLARHAMRGLLPEDVRTQPVKSNLTSFCQRALAGEDAAAIGRLLGATDAELGAYVDLDWVRRSWATPPSGFAVEAWVGTLWLFVSLECWLRLQSDPALIADLLTDPSIPPVRVAEAVLGA